MIPHPGAAVVEDRPDPEPGPGEVLIAVARVGICGTDADIVAGTIPGVTYPLVPGHEWSGEVIAVGGGVALHRIGERVFGDTFVGCGACPSCALGRTPTCAGHLEIGVKGRDGAAAEYVAVPSVNARPMPAGLSPGAGALVEPTSNAVRAVAELRGPVGSVLVRGAGTLGLLAARLLRARHISVRLVDPDPRAVERARAQGFEADMSCGDGVVDGILDFAPSRELASALPLLRDGGTLVVTGFPERAASLPVRQLVERDLRVVGTLGAVDYLDDAARLLADHLFDIDDLVGPPLSLEDAPGVLVAAAPGPWAKTQLAPGIHRSETP